MKEFIVETEDNLKDFTDNAYAQGSFYFRLLLKNRDIRVNGKRVDRNVPLQKGDVVRYYLSPEKEQKPAFYRVYEDENVLVADKESGVNSEAVFSALKGENARFLHRLDRNTKGLMIFAKTDEAERELLELFKTRKVEKIYHALVSAPPKEERGVLTAYLKKSPSQAVVRIYDQPVPQAERIVTEYARIKALPEGTMVEVTLHTGKTHQIRAHLAHIGCPIVGDDKYGDEEENKKRGIYRQCLIAKRLRIVSDGALSYLKDTVFQSRFEIEDTTKRNNR